jgi:hypothetical protein
MIIPLTRSLGASANEERCAEGRALPVVLIMAGPVDCSRANKNRSVVQGLNVELCEEDPLCENANNPAVPTSSGLSSPPKPWTACVCLHSRFHSDTTTSPTTTTNAIHIHIFTTTQGTCGGLFIWMAKGLATLCSYDGEWAIVCRDIDRRLEILNCFQLDLDDEICRTRILPGLVQRPFQSDEGTAVLSPRPGPEVAA